jgi:toxin ParE1/3/4
VTRQVVFAPEAQTDLLQLYDYIAERSTLERALSYTDRIVDYCLGLADFPERGTPRNDLRPGLRVTSFERRVAIAFHVAADVLTIDRILYGGRDLDTIIALR